MAGRPKQIPILKKNLFTTKIPQWLIEWLREQDAPQSQTIEYALIKTYKLTPPKKGDKK